MEFLRSRALISTSCTIPENDSVVFGGLTAGAAKHGRGISTMPDGKKSGRRRLGLGPSQSSRCLFLQKQYL